MKLMISQQYMSEMQKMS